MAAGRQTVSQPEANSYRGFKDNDDVKCLDNVEHKKIGK